MAVVDPVGQVSVGVAPGTGILNAQIHQVEVAVAEEEVGQSPGSYPLSFPPISRRWAPPHPPPPSISQSGAGAPVPVGGLLLGKDKVLGEPHRAATPHRKLGALAHGEVTGVQVVLEVRRPLPAIATEPSPVTCPVIFRMPLLAMTLPRFSREAEMVPPPWMVWLMSLMNP